MKLQRRARHGGLRAWACAGLLLLQLLHAAAAAAAASAEPVATVAPQGEVAEVRQITVRFSQAVVPAGDPRLPAPYTLQCEASGGAPAAPEGSARWASATLWLFDLRQPLPAGTRCTLRRDPAFKAISGDWQGPAEVRFATGGPQVLAVQPYPGSQIDEDQHFLLRLSGAVDPASLAGAVWCEVEGLGERMAVKIVEGPARDQLLRQRQRGTDPARVLLLACQRPFPAGAGVRLVWGAGVAAAGQPTLVSRGERRYEWKVRPRFAAEFSCERENASSPCMPLRPLTLRFNAPLPRALALGARLRPAQGEPLSPRLRDDDRSEFISELSFAAPLPENMRFKLTLPAGLRDDAGRELSNAGSFPLDVATGGLPPLAKFAGAPFGIVEAGPDAMLPFTLRHVQADLAGASTGGRVAVRRFDAGTPDETLLRWTGRLQRHHERSLSAREAGLPKSEWTVLEPETDARGRVRQVARERRVGTREISLLAQDAEARRSELPQLQGRAPRATEVIGLPLPQTGYHVVEIESRVLGHALLATRAPMYVRTGALVTNLGVHFKRGRSSSLVWVSTLDRARPVAGARVAVNDCRGKPLWSGVTDAAGIARIERGFDHEGEGDGDGDGERDRKCLTEDGLFVTARAGSDLSFVFSGWQRGIEPWRFNLPLARGSTPDRRAHTVFDRTLLRAGETVAMKHFVRDDTERGLALPAVDTLPAELTVTHVGSGAETVLPLAWPRGARTAESQWPVPKNAALGLYEVALRRGDQRLPSGSFRVEAFRVPLVDARLAGPAGVLVAPAEVAFAAQINAMAGGPMAAAPLKLSALLRPVVPQFAAFDDFSFEPAGRNQPAAQDADESAGDGSRVVAERLPGSTDKQGAARLVVTPLPALKSPTELVAELSFNDPNGEVQTVTQRLRLWPAGVVVGLRVPSWAASRGEARFTAAVLGHDGRPLAGRAVEVRAALHQTLSTRKRIVGGFYAYDNRRETRELGVLCSGKSDAKGRLNCDVKLDAVGEVELVATARDDAGRVSEAASTVWVTGAGEQWFAQGNDDRIDLLPEQREVEPGQVARLQVRMPFREATALVTVEREGVIDARVLTLRGREPIIELPIPKGGPRSWAPNVTVSALLIRGRLREAPWWSAFTWGWREPGEWWRAFRYEGRDWRAPTALVDLAKPSFKLGVAQLTVGLAEHKLDVTVQPEKAQYGVRETVKTTVRVVHQGRPLAGAEVAFVAVDEGLLALQANTSWELLRALMPPRPWGVETATAQGEIIGRRHYGRKALPPGGGGGRNPTRELFDTLLLWRGTVVLDAKGEARIEVPLNDSLTSFRLVAIADAPGERYGTGSASVRVSQDLQMLSGLPPLARDGDRFDAGFTLRNTTARAMTVKATLAGRADATVLETAPQTVQLAAGAAVEVRWPVQVPAGATRIEWQAEAVDTAAPGGATPPARDRLKIVQAVLPAVPARVWQASLQALEGASPALPSSAASTALPPSQPVPQRVPQTAPQTSPPSSPPSAQLSLPPSMPFSMPIAPPEGALPGLGGVTATLQPRLSGALPGLRRWFETYPYSCLEQKASRAIALRDAPAWAALAAELPGYLDSDGLAGFFPPQPGSAPRGSDRLTAHLVSTAHEAGWAWPDATREAMLRGLAAFVEGRIERRFNAPRADLEVRKLAALEALSRHGRVQPRMLGSITFTPAAYAAWPTSALLDAWAVLRRVEGVPERSTRLADVQRLLRTRLVEGGTTLTFSTEASDDWWWLMDGPDANAARLLLAAVDSPAWQGDVPRIVTGTLARQRGGAWRTTTANVWGVLALERFAAKFEAVPVGGRSVLQWAGAVRTHDWQAVPAGSTVSLPWPAAASAAPAPFTARHEGPGRPWLTVQSLAAVPLKAPFAAGYRVTRSVTAVERKLPDAWTRGDVLRVRLEIESMGDMSWVVVSDPVPAGAALLGGGLARDSAIATRGEQREGRAWPAFEERAADAWRGYYEWMPRGRHAVEYTLRLNTSGRFGLPPTRVEAMYAPENFGESPNATLEVRP